MEKPKKEEKELENLRVQIDALDYHIHDLINERAKLALEVSAIKIKHNGAEANFYRPEREKVVIDQVKAHNKGPLSEMDIAQIFEIIIEKCRLLQIQKNKLIKN